MASATRSKTTSSSSESGDSEASDVSKSTTTTTKVSAASRVTTTLRHFTSNIGSVFTTAFSGVPERVCASTAGMQQSGVPALRVPLPSPPRTGRSVHTTEATAIAASVSVTTCHGVQTSRATASASTSHPIISERPTISTTTRDP